MDVLDKFEAVLLDESETYTKWIFDCWEFSSSYESVTQY